MKPADRAWLVLVAAITAYEVTAARRGWELLSEAVDGYRKRHPAITDGSILYVAAHLLRRWPPRIDPLTALAKLLGR